MDSAAVENTLENLEFEMGQIRSSGSGHKALATDGDVIPWRSVQVASSTGLTPIIHHHQRQSICAECETSLASNRTPHTERDPKPQSSATFGANGQWTADKPLKINGLKRGCCSPRDNAAGRL